MVQDFFHQQYHRRSLEVLAFTFQRRRSLDRIPLDADGCVACGLPRTFAERAGALAVSQRRSRWRPNSIDLGDVVENGHFNSFPCYFAVYIGEEQPPIIKDIHTGIRMSHA